MSNANRIADYQRNEIMTASPGRLVVMLYEGAIKRLDQAAMAFDMDDLDKYQVVNNHIIAAQNIITELTISLDMEKGGEIAQNLFRIYEYFNDQLIEANSQKVKEPIIRVRDMMDDLREAWDTIVRKQEKSEEDNPIKDSQDNFAIQA